MALVPGQIIDNKYRIVRLIGEGGMGAVYEGENSRIRRRVAIKVLHAATAANAEVVTRFEREAQAAGTIGNDHILEVLDLGALPDGDRYMVMEFLDGEPLSARIVRFGKLTPSQLAPIMRQTLEALGAAHAAGIFHRDLKPDNIFIQKHKAGRADYVKLIDFGISKFTEHGGGAVTNMTRAGAIMGTPYYMSPEQANGSSEADHRSDLYAIGVVMYEAITGVVPFDAKTFNELLFQIVLADALPPDQRVPGLDPHFSALIMRAMSRSPKDRFQNASEFDDAIENWTRGRPKSFPPLTGTTAYNVQGQGFVQAPNPGRPPPLTPTPYDRISQPSPMLGAMPTQADGNSAFSSSQAGSWPQVPNAQLSQSQPNAQLSQSQPNAQLSQSQPNAHFSQSQPQGQLGRSQPNALSQSNQELPRGTQNEWNRSQTGTQLAASGPNKGVVVAIAAVFVVVVLGGGVFAATRIFGGGGDTKNKPTAAAAVDDKGGKNEPSDKTDKKPKTKDEGDESDPKTKEGEQAKPKPTADDHEVAPVDSQAVPSPSTSIAVKPTATVTAQSTATVAIKPTAKPTTTPTTKPTGKPKPTAGNPDFGY